MHPGADHGWHGCRGLVVTLRDESSLRRDAAPPHFLVTPVPPPPVSVRGLFLDWWVDAAWNWRVQTKAALMCDDAPEYDGLAGLGKDGEEDEEDRPHASVAHRIR